MTYRHAVFIVAYAQTKKGIEYIILKRKLHWKGWEFPKGGKKFFETYERTVKRELKEETGLKALKIKKFEEKGKYFYKKELSDRKGFVGQTYQLYAVEVEKKKIQMDSREHEGYKWLKFGQALKKLKWANQKKSLKIVDKYLKNI